LVPKQLTILENIGGMGTGLVMGDVMGDVGAFAALFDNISQI